MRRFKRFGLIGVALALLALGAMSVTAKAPVQPPVPEVQSVLVAGSAIPADREPTSAFGGVELNPIEISGGCWIVEPADGGSARTVTRGSAPSLGGDDVVDAGEGTVAADGSLDSSVAGVSDADWTC